MKETKNATEAKKLGRTKRQAPKRAKPVAAADENGPEPSTGAHETDSESDQPELVTRCPPNSKAVANSSEEKIKPLTIAGQRRLVNRLLGAADQAAKLGKIKLTTGDVIRLMQVNNDLTATQPRKLTVEWVEDEDERE